MPSSLDYAKWSQDFDKDFTNSDQDDVLYFMIKNQEFLSKCIRRRIDPKIFSSTVRQKFCKMILDYYDKYTKAPNDDFLTVVGAEIETGHLFTDEEIDNTAEYTEKLFSRNGSSRSNVDFLDDRINLFLKDRIAQTALNDLIKLSGRPHTTPDKFLDIMDKAVVESNLMTGREVVESLRDEIDYDLQSDIITRWNVPYIDKAMLGGFKEGQFGVIFAYTARAKTWAVTHLAKIGARFGNSSLVIPIELANKVFKQRMRQALTGLDKYEVTDVSRFRDIRQIVKASMVKKSDIFFLGEEEKVLSVSELPATIAEIKDKKGIVPKLILIDSADDMVPPPGRYRSKMEQLTAIYTYLKNFAKDTGICTITTSQAVRKAEGKLWLKLSDVGEDINKVRRAMVVITFNASDDEMKIGLNRMQLIKFSDGQAGARCYIYQDLGIGQFVVDYGRYRKDEYEMMVERLLVEHRR